MIFFLIICYQTQELLKTILIGEWEIFNKSDAIVKKSNLTSLYTIEFHLNKNKDIVGSFWKNQENYLNNIYLIEEGLISQFQIKFLHEFSISVINLFNINEILTHIDIKIGNDQFISTKGKFGKDISFNLKILNTSSINIVISRKKSIQVDEYIAIHLKPSQKNNSIFGNYKTLFIILIIILIIQFFIWIGLKICKSSLTQQYEEVKGLRLKSIKFD